MKFIVDEMPGYEEECLFYRDILWVTDCLKRKHACVLSKQSCDRTDNGCYLLKPIEAEEDNEQ